MQISNERLTTLTRLKLMEVLNDRGITILKQMI